MLLECLIFHTLVAEIEVYVKSLIISFAEKLETISC